MYPITDQHIAYVLDDIRRNGIETEDLQLNLLDHICCLAENSLEEGDSFEDFYHNAIRQFYRSSLRELEEETVLLLTFKHYYKMKKIMFGGGILAVAAFAAGSVFKVMHWPGAGILLTAGVFLLSFLFLPLLFILKAREVHTGLEKLTVSIGTLLGMLFCLDILFTVMHWPGGRILWLTTVCISFFIFIPLYSFSGLRRPETRTNTILTSILLVGFTSLIFMTISLRSTGPQEEAQVNAYLMNEQIWQPLDARCRQDYATVTATQQPALEVVIRAEALKQRIMASLGGGRPESITFRKQDLATLDRAFRPGGDAIPLVAAFQESIRIYNSRQPASGRIVLDYSPFRDSADLVGSFDNLYILNSITQLELNVATAAFEPGNQLARR